MNILVTGSAGFIGFHLVKALVEQTHNVTGIDNLNDYYDPALKQARLDELEKLAKNSGDVERYQFYQLDIADKASLDSLFSDRQFDVVVNLAAQAGIRYSLVNPQTYAESNLVGFVNVLECCRHNGVGHLVYASSSSVYGMSAKQPFSTTDRTDFPISLYAATKKSNELMAHSYSHLFDLPTTGLRFFTVYGPWGRPDMAYYKFTKAILEGNPIDVYNEGEMLRDFTFIDDIIDGVVRVIHKIPEPFTQSETQVKAPYRLYNIGHNQPVSLIRFISSIENACGKTAIKKLLPMQPGDVPLTYADIEDLVSDTGFKPSTPIEQGIQAFVDWYANFYGH